MRRKGQGTHHRHRRNGFAEGRAEECGVLIREGGAAQPGRIHGASRLAGIHVALIVIDGVVDLPSTRARMPDKADSFFVNPDDIAATVALVARQPRAAWSFEVEARPFGESW